MHENRETSELSARGSGTDRPEKAESRTTGMNGTEGLDRAVVPRNQPNKGELPTGSLTAEVGEGRERTKENTRQTHTNPTQGGKECVSQGLAGVRQAARREKGERFTALLHHLTLELLRSSFYALKREGAAGVDGVRWGNMKPGWKDGLPSFTAGYTVVPTGHSPQRECTSRRPTGGSVRWGSRHWKTRLFNVPWS
jgi:hypothetical protein